MTLTEFLLARIAEDHVTAQVATLGPWTVSATGGQVEAVGQRVADCFDGRREQPNDAEHIARHDPPRVLAECEAKRNIAKRVMAEVDNYYGGWTEWILRDLAAVYADHPDYRVEWKP